MRHLWIAACALLFWTSAALGCQTPRNINFQCSSPQFKSCAMTVEGKTRYYCQHVPKTKRAMPVVMGFHGAGGRAADMVSLWQGQVENGMILVMPQAVTTGNGAACARAWRQIGGHVQNWADMARGDQCSGGTGAADLFFTQALMERLEKQHAVSGYYAAGFSNGAGFVYQLYITQQMAERFRGFAAINMGLGGAKRRAIREQEASALGFLPNRDLRRPMLLHMATGDKMNFQADHFIRAVDGNEDCGKITSGVDAVRCFYATPVGEEEALFDMSTRRETTKRWLIDFNRTTPGARQSLYPNSGLMGDQLMTVREDFLPLARDGAPVSVLTTLDGGHEWPGARTANGTCPSGACGIDISAEIIRFWRGTAGLTPAMN